MTSESSRLDGAEPDKASRSGCRMRTDAASAVIEVDDECVAMLGYPREELIGKTSLQFVHPDDHEGAIVSWIQMLEHPGTSNRSRLRYIRASGEIFWAEVTYHNQLDEQGWIDREIVDVHDEVDAESTIGTRDRVIRGLAQVLPSGIAQTDNDLRIVYTNAQWRAILALDDPLEEEGYDRVIAEPDRATLLAAMRSAVETDGIYDGEVTVSPDDGGPQRRCRLALRPLNDDDGTTTGYVACLDDITTSWRLQQRLIDQATTDQLTGTMNRAAALDHLDAVLERARISGATTAVIFVDLNEFKRVNDVRGHAAGDELLREVASGISRSVRSNDMVARHGGDEFLVICEDINSGAEALEVGRRILAAVNGRFQIDGQQLEASVSCGLTIAKGGSRTGERMIAEADLAMYEQKRTSGREPRLFQPAIEEGHREEVDLESALSRAVDDTSLVLHYQPIVTMATGVVLGYEALLRWNFGGQLIYPDRFISLAERRGLISRIGAWVIDEVCRHGAAQPSSETTWALNVSTHQLLDAEFADIVGAALDRHGLQPGRLTLELTESSVIGDDSKTVALLHRLTDLGVHLAIDDFGTGYASLDYLRTLPLQQLKIDRRFTADIGQARTNTIVTAIVGLTEALGIDLIIEGVETPEQQEAAMVAGVTLGQGYLFGRPGPWTRSTGDAQIYNQPRA